MRRLLASVAVGLALVAALMVFVDPSLAVRVGGEAGLWDEPPVGGQIRGVVSPPEERPDPVPQPGRNVSIRGTIEALPPEYVTGTWEISVESGDTISVAVTERTMILPPGVQPEVGDSVHILARNEGTEEEEPFTAVKITVEKAQSRWGRPQHFRGEIEVLPTGQTTGTWQVSGISVTVDAKTMIHPPHRTPTEGMVANVVAFEQGGDGLWAMNITLQTLGEAESEVEFEGPIEGLPDSDDFLGTWVVDGMSVTVTNDTELKGATPAISLTAEVKGNEVDGSIVATEIKVKGPEQKMMELEGKLVYTETLPGEWVIDTDPATDTGEISVTVTVSTSINTNRGALEIGSWLEVKALQQPDGTLLAIRIKVEDDPVIETEIDFEGAIAELPSPGSEGFIGRWVIDTGTVSTTVVVTPRTDIAGEPQVEATVKVKGTLQGDGLVHADSIEIQ